jgi:rhodanese-related sulfurtransferase
VSKTDQGGFPAYQAFGTDDLITKILLRARNYFGSFPTQFDMHVYPSVLAQNLEDGNAANNPQVIGVRATADDEKAHLPGAINIPYQKVADVANFTKFVDPSGPVVAYCYTGHTGGLGTMALGILGYHVRNLLYGINGWSTSAPTSGQLKDFDVMRAWDFPVNNGSPQDLGSLADYVPPAGCAGCHDSLTGVFYDREVANVPAAGTAPPSEGEG